MLSRLVLLCHLWHFLGHPCFAAGTTNIYIDLVSGYKDLSTCAEYPLSTLIRDMQNGCGDDSELTSYSCFCTDSYSKFSWDISTAALSRCGSAMAAQATSAVEVFHAYCLSGSQQLSTVFATATTCKYRTGMTRALIPSLTSPKISPGRSLLIIRRPHRRF